MKKVVFCTPTVSRPTAPFLKALEESIPLIQEAGWDDYSVNEIGCPYISAARSRMLRKAMDFNADVFVFIDHDLSWNPKDLLKLIQTEGPVISGTYRFKKDETEYMGALFADPNGRPIVRKDGCVKAHSVPGGFLKITKSAITTFILNYPELLYQEEGSLCIDLFNHGAFDGVWYGEDYSFSRRWREKCGEIWIVPDLSLTHWATWWAKDGTFHEKPYEGNYHEFLLAQPGGSNSSNPVNPKIVYTRAA